MDKANIGISDLKITNSELLHTADAYGCPSPPEPISTVLARFIMIPALIPMVLSTQVAIEPVSTMIVEGTPLMEQATSRRWFEVKRMGICVKPLLWSIAANLVLVSLWCPRGA